MPIGELVTSGSLLLAVPLALIAGIVAFASPCVLPLVPGYLGYIGGLTDTSATVRVSRARLVLGVGLFVLGFSVVFVAFGILFGTAGFLLKANLDTVTRIAGVVVIVLGLAFVGQFAPLQRTLKPQWSARAGLAGAPVLGFIFGIGWTPCMGPTLAAVYTIALDGGSPVRGAVLGLAFCVGLGVPFLLVALGFGWVAGSVSWLKRHIRAINLAGGALLIGIGVLMVTGIWNLLLSNLVAVSNGFIPAL